MLCHPEELYRVAIPQPVRDEELSILCLQHVGQGNEVSVLFGQNRHVRIANFDDGRFSAHT